MKLFFVTISLMFLLVTSGCSHVNTVKEKKYDIEQIENLLSGFNAARYSDIYFSGQPPLDQLRQLKEQGFENIVNLRQANEGAYSAVIEEKKVKEAGLNYAHIPLKGHTPLTDEKIAEITQAIVKNRELGKTLVHCSSGNRVALWVGGHFYNDHGLSKEDAYKIALKAGLTKEAIQETLNNYLDSRH